MVARGHGIEALSAYLGLARAALLDAIVAFDLPTPHDRPLRARSGRNPWVLADIPVFIALWVAGWHADSLAERFGRGKGAVWSKARHLGLPKRERKQLVRPTVPIERLLEFPPAASAITVPATEQAAARRKRVEVTWTRELQAAVSDRIWAGQHYKSIARDLGISAAAIRSRRTRLEIPPIPRLELVDGYDPAAAQKRISAAGYVFQQCAFFKSLGKDVWFWARRGSGRRRSKEAAKTREYFDAQQTQIAL